MTPGKSRRQEDSNSRAARILCQGIMHSPPSQSEAHKTFRCIIEQVGRASQCGRGRERVRVRVRGQAGCQDDAKRIYGSTRPYVFGDLFVVPTGCTRYTQRKASFNYLNFPIFLFKKGVCRNEWREFLEPSLNQIWINSNKIVVNFWNIRKSNMHQTEHLY